MLAGAAAARLRGPYLAGATLALAVGLPALATALPGLPGRLRTGSRCSPPTPPAALGETFPLERWQAWIACLAALLAYVLLANLVRSGSGATSAPCATTRSPPSWPGCTSRARRCSAFVVSAACAGLAGGLLVVVTSLVAPGAFPLALSVALLTGVILGGLGQPGRRGLGRGRARADPDVGRRRQQGAGLPANVQANLALAVYGVVLIGVMLAAPRGIQGAACAALTQLEPRGGACAMEE